MSDGEHMDYPVRGGGRQPRAAQGGVELDAYRVYRGYEGMGEAESAPEFSVRDIFYVLFRHKFKILFIFAIATVASVGSVVLAPDVYKAEAKILIRGERSGLTVNAVAGEGNSFLQPARIVEVQTKEEMSIMQSREVIEKVVDSIGPEVILNRVEIPAEVKQPHFLDPVRQYLEIAKDHAESGVLYVLEKLNMRPQELTDREKAIEVVREAFEILPAGGGANILNLSYASYSPELAQRILAEIVSAYQEKHIAVRSPRISKEYFENKAKELEQDLIQQESELKALRENLNISSVQGQKDMLVADYNNLKNNAMAAEADIKAAEARVDALTKRIERAPDSPKGQPDASMPLNPAMQPVMTKLQEYKIQRAELETLYPADSRFVRDVNEKIKAMERMLTDPGAEIPVEISRAADPVIANLLTQKDTAVVDLLAIQARAKTLNEQMGSVRNELNTINSTGQEVTVRENNVEQLKRELVQYRNSAQTAKISSELDQDRLSNVSEIQAASIPLGSSKNLRKLLAVMFFGIFMGLVGGIGIAFALEYFDHSFKTSEEIEKSLRLPVLVALPRVKHNQPESYEEVA